MSLVGSRIQEDYEQAILNKHSSPRLRRAVLDNPPEPEVPWHEYPVPTHYLLTEGGEWIIYDLDQRPTLYLALKYSDGSIRRSGDWRTGPQTSPPPKPSPSQLMKLDPQGVLED